MHAGMHLALGFTGADSWKDFGQNIVKKIGRSFC